MDKGVITSSMLDAGSRVIMNYFEDHCSEAFARDVVWEVFREMAKVQAVEVQNTEERTGSSAIDDDWQRWGRPFNVSQG